MKGEEMARKRINMKKIRDIIKLKIKTDMSERQIARALNISVTVKRTAPIEKKKICIRFHQDTEEAGF